MYLIVSVVVSFVLAVPIVGYVSDVARDAVLQFNLRQLSKLADIQFIEDGKYPASISELVDSKDAGNLGSAVNYTYQISDDRQRAKILGVFSDRSFCWSSTNEVIVKVNKSKECSD